MDTYYDGGDIRLYHGDALEVARTLPSESVQTIVTSPPYFGLRDYGEDGQIGAEGSLTEYIDRLVTLFRELRRVLKDDGTFWLNLGDSYAGAGYGNHDINGQAWKDAAGLDRRSNRQQSLKKALEAEGIRPKNLMGVPWRVAFALQADGWELRSDIIWAKRNLMPEAVTDRPTKAHEYIFLFAKNPRYYYDADAIREDSDPEQQAHNERYAKEYKAHTERAATTGQPGNVNNVGIHSRPGKPGRNKRSVWTVSSVPFDGAHFAVYPPELIRPCIRAGSRPGDTVLDPFSGSGTTGAVATFEGRKYIGIDLNREYLDLSLRTRFQQPTLAWETS